MDYVAPNTPLWCDRAENKTRFWQEMAQLEQLTRGKAVEVKRLADKVIFVLETPSPENYQIYLTTYANYPQVAPTVLAERNGKAVRVKSATLNHWRAEARLAEIVKEISVVPARRNLALIGGLLGSLVLLVILAGGFLVFTAIAASENQMKAAVLALQEKQAANEQVAAAENRKNEIERQLKEDQNNPELQKRLREAEADLVRVRQDQTNKQKAFEESLSSLDKAKQAELERAATATANAVTATPTTKIVANAAATEPARTNIQVGGSTSLISEATPSPEVPTAVPATVATTPVIQVQTTKPASAGSSGGSQLPTETPVPPTPTPIPTATPIPTVPAVAAPTNPPVPPPTAIPPTPVPPTAIPPTPVPPTAIPPTQVPPTAIPPTQVPPTAIPPTQVPPTAKPPTQVPPTAIPPTQVPPTAIPPTQVPPTAIPKPTPVQPTPVPPTAIPPTVCTWGPPTC